MCPAQYCAYPLIQGTAPTSKAIIIAEIDAERESGKHYVSSSHLGLIRRATPVGVGVMIYA